MKTAEHSLGLFRYFGVEGGIATLKDCRLRARSFTRFNDPFDGLAMWDQVVPNDLGVYERALEQRENRPEVQLAAYMATGPRLSPSRVSERLRRSRRRAAREYQKQYPEIAQGAAREFLRMREELMVVCFTSSEPSTHDELLLWAHYAASHAGIRIGFRFKEAPDSLGLRQVIYSETRLRLSLPPDVANRPAFINHQVSGALALKGKSWEYEREWRLIRDPSQCSEDGGEHYAQMDPAWIEFIDFGVNCLSSNRDELLNLAQKYPAATIRQAKLSESQFALDYEVIR